MRVNANSQRRRQREGGPSISLFPFLAVLICTMGALVPLLFAITKQARLQASQVAVAKQAEKKAELQAQRETTLWRIDQLKTSREKTLEQVSDARLELGHLEDHARRLREKLPLLEKTVEELDKLSNDDNRQRSELYDELKKLQEKIEAAKKQVTAAQTEAALRKQSYAVVPFDGPNQTHRRPIYLECRAEAVVLQPEGIEFSEADFEGPLGPGNPLASTLRAVREYMLANRSFDPQRDGEPYPLLLVRPNGIAAYYAAREAMKSWATEFGYEFVNADWKLSYQTPDPQLAQLVQIELTAARARQQRLIAAAPAAYSKKPKATYRVSPGRGVVREGGSPGDDDDGTDSGYVPRQASGRVGRGYGSAGTSDSDEGQENATGISEAQQLASLYGGTGGGTPGLPGNRPGGSGGNGQAGGGPGGGSQVGSRQGGPSLGGVGSGGQGSGGVGSSGQGKVFGNGYGPANANGGNGAGGYASGNGSGTSSGTYGVGNGQIGGGSGTGGTGIGTIGSSGNATVGSLAGGSGTNGNGNATGGSGGNAIDGGATGPELGQGYPTTGVAGQGTSTNATGTGGFGESTQGNSLSGGGVANANTGNATGAGGGMSSGYPSGNNSGGTPQVGTVNGSVGGASAGGIYDTTGNQASTGQSTAGGSIKPPEDYVVGKPQSEKDRQPSKQIPPETDADNQMVAKHSGALRPGEWQEEIKPPPVKPMEQKLDGKKNAKQPKKMVSTKGRDWGLPDSSGGSVPVTRPIKVECQPNQLTILPESGATAEKTITLGNRTDASTQAFISAVWEHMDNWGIAGRGMYWRPILNVYVKPGSEERFNEFQAMLEGSGLKIVRK